MAELKSVCFCTWTEAPDGSERNFEFLTDIKVSKLPIGPIQPLGLMFRLKFGPKENPLVTIDLYAPKGDRICHVEAKLEHTSKRRSHRARGNGFDCLEIPAVILEEAGTYTAKLQLDGHDLKDVCFSVTVGLIDHERSADHDKELGQFKMRVKRFPLGSTGKDIVP